ncbi:hypothetical protein [Flavobacterium caeni]|uniref:Uncharacterized protein n=1 Tax=Flavobacterium caeni TaxID=490189 RepID=A0A1G5K1N0_9FLAO|nr:hypothetical protein [Flavobacterium caeni]SCY94572.1 hypothetical protein SAMN02927903_03037 [Flavobacterium caeni]
MTPRKELFEKTKAALGQIRQLELVDLDRNQFNDKDGIPQLWTAALIKINAIKWEAMVENKQEGNGTLEITFYCKDGWMNQHNTTTDPDGGLTEIDVIDHIVEKLQFLAGDYFQPLQQTDDEPGENKDGIMSYKIRFSFTLYRIVAPKYQYRKFKHENN